MPLLRGGISGDWSSRLLQQQQQPQELQQVDSGGQHVLSMLDTITGGLICAFIVIFSYQCVRILICRKLYGRELRVGPGGRLVFVEVNGGNGESDGSALVHHHHHHGRSLNLSADQRRAVLNVIFSEICIEATELHVSNGTGQGKELRQNDYNNTGNNKADGDDNGMKRSKNDDGLPQDVQIPGIISKERTDCSSGATAPFGGDASEEVETVMASITSELLNEHNDAVDHVETEEDENLCSEDDIGRTTVVEDEANLDVDGCFGADGGGDGNISTPPTSLNVDKPSDVMDARELRPVQSSDGSCSGGDGDMSNEDLADTTVPGPETFTTLQSLHHPLHPAAAKTDRIPEQGSAMKGSNDESTEEEEEGGRQVKENGTNNVEDYDTDTEAVESSSSMVYMCIPLVREESRATEEFECTFDDNLRMSNPSQLAAPTVPGPETFATLSLPHPLHHAATKTDIIPEQGSAMMGSNDDSKEEEEGGGQVKENDTNSVEDYDTDKEAVESSSSSMVDMSRPLVREESCDTIEIECTFDDNDSCSTGDNACPICLCGYQIGDVLVNSKYCTHVFHKDCLLEWLDKSSDCPICRVEMVTDFDMSKAAAKLVGKTRMGRAVAALHSSRSRSHHHHPSGATGHTRRVGRASVGGATTPSGSPPLTGTMRRASSPFYHSYHSHHSYHSYGHGHS